MTLKTLVNFDVPNSGLGDQPRAAAQKLSAPWSKTYVANQAQFGGATAEAIITATISAAVTDGATAVLVPQRDTTATPPITMLPYNASLVTFNSTVRMIREGGNPTVYDVRAYGAAGDGSTIDTAAIQAAFNGVLNLGGVLYFPQQSGSAYLVDNNIADTGGSTKHVVVMGEGWGTVLRQTVQTFNPLFFISVASCVIENITIDQNWSSGNGNSCIRLDINDARLRNVRCINSGQNGLFWNPVAAGQTTRLSVEGCHFISCGLGAIGGWGIAIQSGKNITVTGCVADACGAGLVDLEPTTAGAVIQNATVVGNTVSGTLGNIANTGAIQAYGSGVNVTFPAIRDINFSGNVIIGVSNGESGIRLADVQRFVCNDNVISSCGRYGIWGSASLGALQFGAIIGNHIYDASNGRGGTDGIFVDVLKDALIADNVVSDDAGITRYGLNISSNCQRVARRNNFFPRSLVGGGANADWVDSQSGTLSPQGIATLVGGTVTVSTTLVRTAGGIGNTGSQVKLWRLTAGGTLGDLSVGTIVDKTSFVINSSSGTDTSVVAWEISQ